MPIEFAVLGLLTESLDKIVKVVVGGGQLADFKHIPHLLCFLVVHGLISPKSGYSEHRIGSFGPSVSWIWKALGAKRSPGL